MLESIADHTLDTALLQPGCHILDVGCHGFAFGDQLRQRFAANVYEVDLNDLGPSRTYHRCGIAAADGFGDVSHDPEPQCRRLIAGNRFPVYTVESFRQRLGVPHWDVLKLDCEGSEYDILWNLSQPPATQISVEFHQHTAARRSEEFIAQIVAKLGQWYEVKLHIRDERHCCGFNWWDSLFVLCVS